MINIFESVERFFTSVNAYIDYNAIFIIFLSLFIFTILVVIISTSQSYEAKLIKAIDMFNNYFIDNPQITEDNLVQFNNRMKMRKVPKQLRKQWQQFVLYRENKASSYMSFEACVSTPIKNSTYKRDVNTMNIIAYILAFLCFLFNIYRAVGDVAMVLQSSLLCPILILVLNYIVTIFLDLRHNAIVSDLNSNYQYFEVNIDKATQTLPDYVDYEVLFDRNEIKRGIPILYAYLQKRAEEEQKELEKARLKNVEHEKFNFDEAGVASSLVLERAMQEAENYIAERKKYLQDIEMINSDITQEEMNFRETTKEYQRQMQVSKETFENFKQQLEEVTSSIQANYLKKQQQQELDRQRNLERDYDTATDRHKKLLDNYQQELKSVEDEIKKARTALEKAMMSEFDTYSNKVYEEAYKVVEEREAKKTEELNTEITNLTEQLKEKENELTSYEQQNQDLINQLNLQADEYQNQINEREQVISRVSDEVNKRNKPAVADTAVQEQYQPEQPEQEASEYYNQYDNDSTYQENYSDEDYYNTQNDNSNEYAENEQVTDFVEQPQDVAQPEQEVVPEATDAQPEIATGEEPVDDTESVDATDIFNIVETKPRKKAGRPKKKVKKVAVEETAKEAPKRRGRPKKSEQPTDVAVSEQASEPKRRGRPKKQTTEQTKETVTNEEVKVSRRGRPRKQTEEVSGNQAVEQDAPKRRGRPKKQVEDIATTETVNEETPKRRGRPKKSEQPDVTVSEQVEPKRRGRPRKETTETQNEQKTTTTQTTTSPAKPKKGRGRPKKVDIAKVESNIDDLDAYLDEINDQIAKESAKMEDAKKKLEKKSKISKKN